MSLQAVYGGQSVQVAACFALSSFLCSQSQVYQALAHQGDTERPDLFLSCGTEDSLVRAAWVEDTRDRLAGLGVAVTHYTVPGLQHQLESEHLNTLIQWRTTLPSLLPVPVRPPGGQREAGPLLIAGLLSLMYKLTRQLSNLIEVALARLSGQPQSVTTI